MSSVPAVLEKNNISRQEFGASQIQTQAETAIAAVSAREQAKIQAMFVMAERHPRSWDNVRVRLLLHCERVGFAEIARYSKPAGRKKVNGKWIETFAEGLSARFAEIARQEMTNTATETSVIYEDDLIRIVRASVMDLERNSLDSREITIAKAVEKRGKKDDSGNWQPPEGREVLSQRITTYGDPTYLVRATDDEIRSKQNSEISKAQRDESLRLIPKDIRDDCEARVLATLADPKKCDPVTARKKIIDGFAQLGVMPDDLVTYIGCQLERCSPVQLGELRGLWTAIKDGETDFQSAMKFKYDGTGSAKEAGAVADEKLAKSHDSSKRSNTADVAKSEPEQAELPRNSYTKETIPDANEVPVGTECHYEGKVLRAIQPEGEAAKWVAVELIVDEAPPAPKREAPKFGRKG